MRKPEISVREAAKRRGVATQTIYYAAATGHFRYSRGESGTVWVDEESFDAYNASTPPRQDARYLRPAVYREEAAS